jgi:hypothetical protein
MRTTAFLDADEQQRAASALEQVIGPPAQRKPRGRR